MTPDAIERLAKQIEDAFDIGRDAVLDRASINKSEFSCSREHDEAEDEQAEASEAVIDAGRKAAVALLTEARQMGQVRALREKVAVAEHAITGTVLAQMENVEAARLTVNLKAAVQNLLALLGDGDPAGG